MHMSPACPIFHCRPWLKRLGANYQLHLIEIDQRGRSKQLHDKIHGRTSSIGPYLEIELGTKISMPACVSIAVRAAVA